MYDILIIGGGTAGLTAAIYAARSQKSVLLLEGETFGGQIVNSPLVENYPALPGVSGYDYTEALKAQALSFGTETKSEQAKKIEKTEYGFKVSTRRNEYESHALILALGAKPRKLGLDKEEELIGSGVSFCATCDGAFFKGKKVAVCGGGETAVQDAIYLANICSEVTLIHRREAFRAKGSNIDKLRELPNVRLMLNRTVTALKGDLALTGLTVTDVNTGESEDIAVNGLFEAVGQIPSTEIAKDLVELDRSGYIIAGEDCATAVPGLYAAGDCRTKTLRQLTTAAADGSQAATAAVEYLSEI